MDNEDMLVKITAVLGSDQLNEYVSKYRMPVSKDLMIRCQEYPGMHLSTFRKPKNQHLATDLAIDLLSKMLVLDQTKRIYPKAALKHPYFAPIWELKKTCQNGEGIERAMQQLLTTQRAK